MVGVVLRQIRYETRIPVSFLTKRIPLPLPRVSSFFFPFFSLFFFLNLSLHPSGKILLLPFPPNREIFLRLKSFLRFVVIIIGSLDLLHSCE